MVVVEVGERERGGGIYRREKRRERWKGKRHG